MIFTCLWEPRVPLFPSGQCSPGFRTGLDPEAWIMEAWSMESWGLQEARQKTKMSSQMWEYEIHMKTMRRCEVAIFSCSSYNFQHNFVFWGLWPGLQPQISYIQSRYSHIIFICLWDPRVPLLPYGQFVQGFCTGGLYPEAWFLEAWSLESRGLQEARKS